MSQQQDSQALTKKKKTDFRLLVARLENAITKGQSLEKCKEALRREKIWKRLNASSQLKWAKLAQMAGEIPLALNILAHINETSPQFSEAWYERLELLAILDKREEMAQVLAAAGPYLDKSKQSVWLSMLGPHADSDHNITEPELTPFMELKERRELIELFLELFSGREDCFARQWVNKEEGKQGYVPVRRPMEEGDVEDHLSGRKTYGIYLLRSDSTVKVAVIDVDIVSTFRQKKLTAQDKSLLKRERLYLFTRIEELAEEMGLFPVKEFSGGKGYHFWFFFESPCPAARIRQLLEYIKGQVARDVTAFNLEVFPKQDVVSAKGLGNLVKLPLGIHRLTGKRSYFLDCADKDPNTQLRFLKKVKRSRCDELKHSINEPKQAQVLVHPKMKEWAEKYPELAVLELKCPPIGQIIASCRNGHEPSVREEKILFQTIGFLENAKSLLHHVFCHLSEYNPHLVDFKLSRLRGKPLGCKRIHSLLNYIGDFCPFGGTYEYAHPLLHLDQWREGKFVRSEKVEDLKSAIENLKAAIIQVERFLK